LSGLGSAINLYQTLGNLVVYLLLISAAVLSFCIPWQVIKPAGKSERFIYFLLVNILALLSAGSIIVIWFHWEIYQHVALSLPEDLAHEINRWLTFTNSRSSHVLPLYDWTVPPRYKLPFWLEDEKYLFWFLTYAGMAFFAWNRLNQTIFRILLQVLLVLQVFVLCLLCNPFDQPLPLFFEEISPWFSPLSPISRLNIFMQLYPKLVFYYNAHYMWLHPPLLFLSYAGLTVFFAGCVSMLWTKEKSNESVAYSYAKISYLFLTLGMLIGYPWALEAWGPNWWWDPKVSSSLMMWIVFSTYLHARLFLSRGGMWNFVGSLGILCFCAMLFTFMVSFFFPGEHTGH
jgi:hypothetical protein